MPTVTSPSRVRRVDCGGPGWTLRRRGRGIEVRGRNGQTIRDEKHLERIRALGIPPAWKDVWICPDPAGHIQATGTDAAGRTQYRYHDTFIARRARAKFTGTLEFARELPAMRARVEEDLQGGNRDRETVLACMTRLLDRGFFRVGTETYAARHRTFGLTTLEKRHVTTVHGDVLVFDYTAKHGLRRVQNVIDPRVAEIVGTLRRRRGGGDRLFAWHDGSAWRPVSAGELNEHLREITGLESVSSKSFRTWNATVLAAVALAVADPSVQESKRARERVMRRAADEVAHYLGNTAAVCRSSYIDPRVFDLWQRGRTIRSTLHDLEALADPGELATHGEIETAVLDLLS